MSERTNHDRLRDLLDARLPPAEADALRREIAADPALRDDFERLRVVHELTAAAPAVPPSSVRWTDVAPRGRVLGMRRWAVAAGLLAAGGIGLAADLWLTRARPHTVELAALRVPGAGTVPDADPVQVPAALATFEPVRDGGPNWIASWDEGLELARATRKPVLVYLYHPTCPWCRELDTLTFRDADVQRRIAEFVPVRLNVLTASPELQERTRAGWPYIALIEADGRTIREMAGVYRLDDVRPEVACAEEDAAKASPARPTWAQVREAAADLGKARAAAEAGRLGEAWSAARSAEVAAPATAPARAATSLAASLEVRAERAIADAARVADADAAAAVVEAEAQRFAGSAPGGDLDAIVRAIRVGRAFPVLTEAKR
jgi:hypothetical protein